MRNADYLERFVASLVDSLISFTVSVVLILLPVVFVAFIIFKGNTSTGVIPTESAFDLRAFFFVLIMVIVILFLLFLINFFFYVYRPFKHNGQTYGKQLMNIKVVRIDGMELTLGLLTLRLFVSALLNNAISFLTYIPMFFDQDRRTVYDMILGTKVVTTNR